MAEELLKRIAWESVETSAKKGVHIKKVYEEKVARQGWRVKNVEYSWRKAKRETWTFIVETDRGETYAVEITRPRANLPPEWLLNEVEIVVFLVRKR
jgi:hypothetical protein